MFCLVAPTAAYLAGMRWAGFGRYSREISPSEVESPMCTTERHDVRPGITGSADAARWVLTGARPLRALDAGRRACPPGCWRAAVAAESRGADRCSVTTTPVSTAKAVPATATGASRRDGRVMRGSRGRRPRRIGSSTRAQLTAEITTVAATTAAARDRPNAAPSGGAVSTMIG